MCWWNKAPGCVQTLSQTLSLDGVSAARSSCAPRHGGSLRTGLDGLLSAVSNTKAGAEGPSSQPVLSVSHAKLLFVICRVFWLSPALNHEPERGSGAAHPQVLSGGEGKQLLHCCAWDPHGMRVYMDAFETGCGAKLSCFSKVSQWLQKHKVTGEGGDTNRQPVEQRWPWGQMRPVNDWIWTEKLEKLYW